MLFICSVLAFKFFQHLLLFYLSSTQTDMAAVSNKVNYILSFSPNKMVCYYKLLIEFLTKFLMHLFKTNDDAAFITNNIQSLHQIVEVAIPVKYNLN